MSNNTQLISRPIKDGCIFNAVGNPIIYHLRREEYQYSQINNDGGFAQFQVDGEDLTAYFEADNDIYAEAYGLGMVTAVAFSAGNTLITTDITYVAGGAGYINNLSKRTDYKIELEVFDYATGIALGPRIVDNPGSNGEIKTDISGIVRSFLRADWQLPVLNEAESDTSKKIFIKYQEFFDQTYWELISDEANPIVCIFAIMHLLQNSPPDFSRYPHGGNMLLYCPDDNSRKWLTRFPQPSMWRDWPFTLSFLWSDFPGISKRLKQYSSEGTLISDTSNELDYNADNVHRVIAGAIYPDATLLLISLEQGSSGSGLDQILEEITVNVKDPCANQLMLFWKNSKGGDSFWMFDESQDYQWTYPNGRITKRMTLFADNLTVSEWDSINELNSNTEVVALNIVDYGMDDSVDKTHFRDDNQVFIINQDASKTGVIIIPTDNKTKTIQKKHAIEITIELPEFFTV